MTRLSALSLISLIAFSGLDRTTGEIFFEEGFEDGDFESRGWYDNTALTRSTREVHSGSGALEVRFEAGATVPTFGGAARHLFEETETLYVRFRVKYSSDWVGSGVGYHPHDFQILTNLDGIWTGPASTHLTTYIETLYRDGAIRPVLALGDRLNIDADNIDTDLTDVTENRAVAGCNGETDGYPTTCWSTGSGWGNGKTWRADDTEISTGEWHLVEVLFEMNSIQEGIGIPDGVVRYRLDGDLVLDRKDVLFRTGANPDMRFDQFLIAPYIGDGSPVTQTMWIDDLLLADGR